MISFKPKVGWFQSSPGLDTCQWEPLSVMLTFAYPTLSVRSISLAFTSETDFGQIVLTEKHQPLLLRKSIRVLYELVPKDYDLLDSF